ncbi:MAG TPA: hypothetical protein VG074_14995 [Acidimicrobiales bacterium]|jgi:hypothetical protein|nr:hypothetical protein [Acidimicrobiales bacterium]
MMPKPLAYPPENATLSGLKVPRKKLPIVGACIADNCRAAEIEDAGVIRAGDAVNVFGGEKMMHLRCYEAEPRDPDGRPVDDESRTKWGSA